MVTVILMESNYNKFRNSVNILRYFLLWVWHEEMENVGFLSLKWRNDSWWCLSGYKHSLQKSVTFRSRDLFPLSTRSHAKILSLSHIYTQQKISPECHQSSEPLSDPKHHCLPPNPIMKVNSSSVPCKKESKLDRWKKREGEKKKSQL